MLTTGRPEPLYLVNNTNSNDGDIFLPNITNISSYYAITLTGSTFNWLGSGTPGTVWHDEASAPPSATFDRYYWRQGSTTSVLDPADVPLSGMGSSFSHNFSQVINTGTSGDFDLDFTAPIGSYRHHRDFQVTLNYRVGNLTCQTTVRGLYGPVIEPTLPANSTQITGPFAIGANAYDPDPGGSINKVVFEVLDSTGTSVAVFTEYTSPYCLGGDNGSVCNTLRPYTDNWPGTSQRIANGIYTIRMSAQDNDNHRQSTRIVRTITINAATPTPTRTSPATRTPGPTKPPTITLTPSRTGVPTQTGNPTQTPTDTPSAPTSTPVSPPSTGTAGPPATSTSAPPTPTPTPTRTPCTDC